MTQITLSIIIPFYRNAIQLNRLLKSIEIALVAAELELETEILIINDSPEVQAGELENILQEAKNNFKGSIELITNIKNSGVAFSRNVGLNIAKGEFLHLIDQDDEIKPAFYQTALVHLKTHDFVLTNGLFVYDKQKSYRIYYFKPLLTLKNLILDDFIRSPGQVVFKKSILGNLRFPEPRQFKGGDDRFFWILLFNLNRNIKAIFEHKPLYLANLHLENFSLDSTQLYQCCFDLWNQLSEEDFGSNQKYVNENINCLKYILKKEQNLVNWMAFVRYKYKLNRLVRFAIKKVILK